MTLSIHNIDLHWRNEDVQQLFSAYGAVSGAEVAIDVFTERSRGFAHVIMPSEEEAAKAMTALHNTEVNGRVVEVRETVAKAERKGSYKVGNGAVSAYRFRK